MTGRLEGKRAVVVGAGQTPGETVGNGRAMALLFAREGAQVLCVDRAGDRAQETARLIEAEGGKAFALEADISKTEGCEAVLEAAKKKLRALDILVNNVGIGGGDAPAHVLEEAAFDRILGVNLKAMWLMTRAALPVMRVQRSGAIVNISSLAALAGATQLAYEISKAGVNRLTQHVAAGNAKYGIRCNAILPGFMDTPMAIEGIARATGRSTEEVREGRDARVPLGGKQGTGWDTAYAALFLASDEAKFITGVLLPVDGGMGVRVG
jgi:NAD(P)-dependent dehydrogenase (short-subunit alcohol dehydrogenase family)